MAVKKTKRVRKVSRDAPAPELGPYARWTGEIVSRGSFPTSAVDRGYVKHHFLPLPADRTLEIRWDLDDDFDGSFEFPDGVSGARVKPVIHVPEGKVGLVDRDGLRKVLLDAGAIYCKAPTVHVARRKVKRDERHAVEVPLEESLRIFAEETNPRDPDRRVEFAAALAREADAGAKE